MKHAWFDRPFIFDQGSGEVEFKRHGNSEAPSVSSWIERPLFRPDLYHRLSGVDIRYVPLSPTRSTARSWVTHSWALRERCADIVELARRFLQRHRRAAAAPVDGRRRRARRR
jgi:transcriptional regulator of aromatic amino acid metabolism